MRGRTPAEAVSNYIDPIQLAVSCVTDSIVSVDGGYYPSALPHLLTMNREIPVRLGGESRLWFLLYKYYRIVESDSPGASWMVAETGYHYAFIDADGRDVFEYHWHPVGQSPIITPHLHIGYGAMVGRAEISNAHFLTGYVSISGVLRMLIRDFDVTPRRPDWESVLDEDSTPV